MKRIVLSLLLTFFVVLPLQAHFLFLVPEADGKSAILIFSDSLEPDRAELMAKVTGTKVQFRAGAGQPVDLKWTDQKESFLIASPDGKSGLVSASLKYGVVAKGDTPFLLNYYAAAWLPGKAATPVGTITADDKLPFQIVPQGQRKFQVLWQGKPLADTAVSVVGAKSPEIKTDAQGAFELPASVTGLVGLRARQVEAKAGELDGKAYQEVRSYATLVVRIGG